MTGLIPGKGKDFYLCHHVHTSPWAPYSLLSNGYQGLFPQEWSGQGMKTTHLHLVLRSRICGATPPLSLTSLWGAAWVQGQLYLNLHSTPYVHMDRFYFLFRICIHKIRDASCVWYMLLWFMKCL